MHYRLSVDYPVTLLSCKPMLVDGDGIVRNNFVGGVA